MVKLKDKILCEKDIRSITRPGLHRVAAHLYVRVSPGSGRKVWTYRYTLPIPDQAGLQRYLPIGDVATVSLFEALATVARFRKHPDPVLELKERKAGLVWAMSLDNGRDYRMPAQRAARRTSARRPAADGPAWPRAGRWETVG